LQVATSDDPTLDRVHANYCDSCIFTNFFKEKFIFDPEILVFLRGSRRRTRLRGANRESHTEDQNPQFHVYDFEVVFFSSFFVQIV
jgi:hypothetical protein